MSMQVKLIEAYQMMRLSKRILIIAHLRPDGDALSSVAAMRLIAQGLGKETACYCKDKNQELFSYLSGFAEIEADWNNFKLTQKVKESLMDSFDLIIVNDCGSLARTGLVAEIKEYKNKGGKIIEFDHHPRIDEYAGLEIRYPGLSSTSELIYRFIIANKIFLSKELADCILTGILTDTGNLLYPSASEATLKAVAATLTAGAHYSKIVNYTLKNKDINVVKMWGLALERLKINQRYQVATAVITRQDINNILGGEHLDSAAESDLFSGLAGFLSNLAGVKAIAFIYEDVNGFIKGSLRSTSNGFMVDKLARTLGGGGHERASGFSFTGRLEKINNNWQVIK
ncbi:bifunctional oligoribonuclease/PAP phosphatase NrnA [Patescibacteria group bacterium]|nr:bifunctional oligoribonuclease/PAP phosphatase NrnA [Patescibacteria group bacterium]